MSYYGPASGIYGGRGGNYSSSQSAGGSGTGGSYGAQSSGGGTGGGRQASYYGPSEGSNAYAYHHGVGSNGAGSASNSTKGRGKGNPSPAWSAANGSSGGGGSGGYPWWEHVKGNGHSKGKAINVNDMSPEVREAHLAEKAAQKHVQRLADPEPEKLEVPQKMLSDVFYAATDVLRNAGPSNTKEKDTLPARRSREIFGTISTVAPTTPPPPSHKGAAYEEIQQGRRKLPAFSRQDDILNAVNNNQVVVISGETGCGKTTQVPQFLMDQYRPPFVEEMSNGGVRESLPLNIVCTQPRRISAIGVAERVAAERGESVGGTVGYQIRLERRASEHTRLMFVTTGILLRRLQADPQLEGVTHVILDEVHERTVDSDFLIIILRDLIATRKDLHLVLMSATLNAELFSDYFGNAPKLNIPGYTFPVQEFYLEDALELTRTQIMPTVNRQGRVKRKPIGKEEFGEKVMKLSAEFPVGQYSHRTLESLAMYDESEVPLDVIVDLVQHIHNYEGEGAILIFLSGWEEISAVHDRLEALSNARHWRLYALHSQMPTSQQRDVFLRPPRGTRKIVIATNIAESSITIDDVVYVIDGGKHKEKSYDPEAKVQSLLPAWVSQASSKQRKGRAGRVQPGRCWHLYPRSKFGEMDEYQLPEIVRTSLESLCLQVRHLGLAVSGRGGVASFINKALTPPADTALDNALTLLTRIGAFRGDESLTPLGKHLALLPVEPQIGKALVFGCLLGCLDPVLTIAALLSQRNPFVMPMNKKEQADLAKRRFAQGEPSDHLCLYNAFEAWRMCPRRDQPDFCHMNFLSPSALRTASEVRGQFQALLRDAGLIPRDRDHLAELNRHSEMPKYWPVVRAAMSSGLYPNLVRVDYGKKKFKLLSSDHSTLNPHPSSVTAEGNLFNRRWAYYHEMCRTPGGLFIYDLTEAAPLPLLLFGAGDPHARGRGGALINKSVSGSHIQGGGGGKKKKGKKKGYAQYPTVGPFAGVEPWVYFNVGGDQPRRMLEDIRAALDYVVGEHVGGARSSEKETRLINTVAQALVGEEELAHPTKPGGGHDRSHNAHGVMRTYNVDADDEYEFHKPGPPGATGEYRGSGANVYHGYTVTESSNTSSSSRSLYTSSGMGGGSGGPSYSSHASAPAAVGRVGLAGGGNNHSSDSNSSGHPSTGYHSHSHSGIHRGYGGSSPASSSAMSDKPPQVGDARYAAAQAAVAAALRHTAVSASSSGMPAAVARSNAGYGQYSMYSPLQRGSHNGASGGSGSSHHGHPSQHHQHHHRGGNPASMGGGPSPGVEPVRYNPNPSSNGEASSSSGYHVHGGAGGSVRADSGGGGGSQPRSLARQGNIAAHEYNPAGSRSRSSSAQPVSTVLGGGYHNYAVPPNAMPLGGGGGSEGQHYVHRSVSHGRGEASRDSRDRDVSGGRGGKRGRW